jgi:hypothetical protein
MTTIGPTDSEHGSIAPDEERERKQIGSRWTSIEIWHGQVAIACLLKRIFASSEAEIDHPIVVWSLLILVLFVESPDGIGLPQLIGEQFP